MREILINICEEEKRVAFLEDKKLDEYYIERESGEQLVGNIYKGRVINITAAIQAAFVDVGLEKNGFLHVSDIIPEVSLYRQIEEKNGQGELPDTVASSKVQDLLKEKQEVLVQVVKAPIGTKGPRLTTNISIPGRHIVLMPSAKLRGVSRKIVDRAERSRIKQMLDRSRLPKDMGVIVRTAALGIDVKSLNRELKYLLVTWKRIQRRIKITKTPGRVHSELDLVLRIVRDALTEKINKVVIDSKREYKRIRKFVCIFLPKFKTSVEFYNKPQPLFDGYNIEKEISRLLGRKVWLKCGGYLVIDPAEALVVVDVNSGRYVKTKDVEQTALKTNVEAAREIGRQLRLRNIGGIVVIDFIDMEDRRNQRQVLKELKDSTKKDKAKINIYPFSRLGLVQLTRQRVKDTIAREVFQACPYCRGRGRVKAVATLSIEIKRKIQEHLRSQRVRSVKLTAHPDIVRFLQDEGLTLRWRKFLRVRIDLAEDKSLHIEEYTIK